MSDDLIKVASTVDFNEQGFQVVEHDDREILLCQSSDGIYAVDNLCSHAEEKLCFGKLKGGKVFCPLHGAAFDIKTGAALSRPATEPIETFDIVIEGYDIFLRSGSD